MDWQKNLLLVAIFSVIFLLVIRWHDYDLKHTAIATSSSQNLSSTPSASSTSSTGFIAPTVPTANTAADATAIPIAAPSKEIIKVKTDTLNVEIDPTGGDIVRVTLPKFSANLKTPEVPFLLLENSNTLKYSAQSGLAGKNGPDAKARPVYATEKNNYELAQGQDSISINLNYEKNSVKYTKRYTFKRNNYLVTVDYIVDNQSTDSWSGNFLGRILHNNKAPAAASGIGMAPFLGGATTTTEEKYKKIKFEDLDKTSKDKNTFTVSGGYVSLVQHYFISAWIPPSESQNTYQFYKENADYIFQYISPEFTAAPNTKVEYKTSFYAGPKDTDKLKEISENLYLTIDYGWFWWISVPLFAVLKFIQTHIFSNWGFAIMLLILGIKLLFYPLSAASYKSMAKLRKLTPKLQDLKERYGDDRQKMSQETMKLYQTEKVNPLGGCLPMLIQMPVFLAFYYMLMESVELRHAPFILWIVDLSVMDPLFVLPLIYGATMWAMQKLNPQPTDPMQAKIMMFLPVVFTFLFLWFPAGLVLYWITNNVLSIAQQYVITKRIEAEK